MIILLLEQVLAASLIPTITYSAWSMATTDKKRFDPKCKHYLHIDITQTVEVLPQVRHGPTYSP